MPLTLFIVLFFSLLAYIQIKYPDMDCECKNAILLENTYDSEKYNIELIKLLESSDIETTKFWFDKYIDPKHISMRIQNENICATGIITVPKMSKEGEFMNNLMAAKGKSYGGPLVGVELDFIEGEIVLTNVKDIID